MKRIATLLLLLLSALLFAQGWKPLTSSDGKFTVQIPGKPQASSRTDQDGGYSIVTKMWVSGVADSNYVVSVSFLPGNVPPQFTKNMMDGIKSGFVKSTSATVVSDKPQAYNGLSGRLIRFEIPGKAKGAMWVAAKAGKVFTLTLAKGSGDYGSDLSKMFGSFKAR